MLSHQFFMIILHTEKWNGPVPSKDMQTSHPLPPQKYHIYMKYAYCAKPNEKSILRFFLIFIFRVMVNCIYNFLACHLNFQVCQQLLFQLFFFMYPMHTNRCDKWIYFLYLYFGIIVTEIIINNVLLDRSLATSESVTK